MKTCDENQEEELNEKMKKIEAKIAELVAEENKDKVVKKFKTLSNNDELVNTNVMWNLKRKMFPKNKETLPFAKQDFIGKLISSQKNLKILYLDTFVHRLRSRPMKEYLIWLKNLKEELCSETLKLCKLKKSNPWTMGNLRKILKSLKTNKVNYKNKNYVDMFCSTCRDPNTEDSQEHLLQCVSLKNQNTVLSVPDVPKYENSNPDWSLTIRKDLEELSLNLNFEEIKLLSKKKFNF